MPPKIPGFGAEPHSMLFNVLRRSLIILVLFHESVGFIPTDSAEYPTFYRPLGAIVRTRQVLSPAALKFIELMKNPQKTS